MPRTALCELLGIEHPILNAGIGPGAGPELAAAVSEAGGYGVIGVSGQPPERVRELLRRTRELTERPFGANVILDDQGKPELAEGIRERCSVLLEERVPLLVFFEGDPAPFVDPRTLRVRASRSRSARRRRRSRRRRPGSIS